MTHTLLQLVLAAHALGLSLFPVNHLKRPYKGTSWRPHQFTRAREDQILRWDAELHPWGWANLTGRGSGVFVLDFDGPDGRALLERLDLPQPHVETPRGGRHLYVVHPGWPVKTIQSQSGGWWARQWKGLDIRGDGGYAVAIAPGYDWTRNFEPVAFEALPPALREAIKRVSESGGAPASRASDAPALPTPQRGTATEGFTVRGDPLATRAFDQVGAGRNQAGFLYARDLFWAGCSREEAEARGPGFVAEANRLQPLNQHGEPEEYRLEEFMRSVGSVSNLADRADALASKALKEGLRGAPLSALVVFLGVMLETGRDELLLSIRQLMLRAGIKSRATAERAIRVLESGGYLAWVGAARDRTSRYKLLTVYEPGQESFSYSSLSFLSQLAQHEAFYHKALGKHVLVTMQIVLAAPHGITLAELVARGPYQPRTHQSHLEILANHDLTYEENGKLYADFEGLTARLSRVAQVEGTEGQREQLQASFKREREAYKRLVGEGLEKRSARARRRQVD